MEKLKNFSDVSLDIVEGFEPGGGPRTHIRNFSFQKRLEIEIQGTLFPTLRESNFNTNDCSFD